jgi:hypothetical protein
MNGPNVSLQQLGLDNAVPHVLLGQIRIAGVPFHLEAIEVVGHGREESMCAVNPDAQDRIDMIASIDAGGGHPGYATVSHGKKRYFVVAYPHQL